MLAMSAAQTTIAERVQCDRSTVARIYAESQRPPDPEENPVVDSLEEHLKDHIALLCTRYPDAKPGVLYEKLADQRPELAALITARDKAGAVRRLMLGIIMYKRAVARPPLTEEQKAARFRFVVDFPDRDAYFDSTIFSDEMMIARTGNGYRWITGEDTRYSAIRVAAAEKVMVWGAVSVRDGPLGPLVIWPPGTIVDAARYQRDVLAGQVGPAFQDANRRASCRLQQDGARVHWTAASRGWAAASGVPLLEGWPAHSPDLSIIELVWARVKAIVNSTDPAVPIAEALQAAWIEATKETSLAEMKQQMMVNWDRCVESGGDNRHATA